MYIAGSKRFFLGYLKGPLSALHYLTFFNDFFHFINKASVHNFADDNSLSAFESNIKNLKIILESESKKAISWFQSNKINCYSREISRHYHRQKETKSYCGIHQYWSEKYENFIISKTFRSISIYISQKFTDPQQTNFTL